MKTYFKLPLFWAAFLCLVVTPVGAQVPISHGNITYENFDDIGTSTTATLPSGWRADGLSGNARTVGDFFLAGDTTTANGGTSGISHHGIYNFGAGDANTATDRAVGFLTTSGGTHSGNLYVQLTNTDTEPISGLRIGYDVEKYRMGSNPAGFRFQLFYSYDGVNWSDAGQVFQTFFSADASNSLYNPTPGDTVKVLGYLSLPTAVEKDDTLYLAWNYSVASGTNYANAQALAIDNLEITPNEPIVPSNHVTNFQLHSKTYKSIILSWDNSIGPLFPEGYLIRMDTIGFSNINDPVDGVEYTSSTDFNITYGISQAEFTDLEPEKTYYFKIFPFSGSGSYRLYKTDGTVPEVEVTTYEDLSASHYKTVSSGNWKAKSNWEFSTDSTNWSAALYPPDENALSVVITSPFIIEISSTVHIANLTIEEEAILEWTEGEFNLYNKSSGYDITIEGVFLNNGPYADFKKESGSSILVKTGGEIEVKLNGASKAQNFAGNGSKGWVYYETGAVYFHNLNLGSAIASANQVYFPDAANGISPIFRISGSRNLGSNNTTIFNGVVEMVSGTLSLIGKGEKLFRDGISLGAGATFNQPDTGSIILFGNNFYLNSNNGTINIIEGIMTISDSTELIFEGNLTINGSEPLLISNSLEILNNSEFSGMVGFEFVENASIISQHSDGIMGAFKNTGTNIFHPEVSYKLNGNQPQFAGLPSTNILHLEIDNSSVDGVELDMNLSVDGNLILVNGILNTDSYTITLNDGSLLEETNTSYILGTVTAEGEVTNSNETFGNIGLEIQANGDQPGQTVVTRVTGFSFTHNGNSTINRYYDVAPTVNSGLDATIVFHYLNNAQELNGIPESELVLVKSSDQGASFTLENSTLDMNSQTLTLSGLNSFSIISATSFVNPIPVELISFRGELLKDDVILEWITASESNNMGFDVQRSLNGNDWEVVSFVPGEGNSATKIGYSIIDYGAMISFQKLFYRLKQIDYNGDYEYSNVLKIEKRRGQASLVKIQQNDNHLKFTNPLNENAYIEVFSLEGKLIQRKVVLGGGVGKMEKPFTKGIYLIRISSSTSTEIIKKHLY